jgi:hypothetical protein
MRRFFMVLMLGLVAYRSRSGKDATGFHGIIYTVADLQPLRSG